MFHQFHVEHDFKEGCTLVNDIMSSLLRILVVACAALSGIAGAPLRLAIAGLVHGHVDGFLNAVQNRNDVRIVGVFDPDTALQHKYAQKYGFADALFFTDLAAMLDRVKPEAVATFTSTFDHPMVVEACASPHIDVMMEKPLAVQHGACAGDPSAAAQRGGIHVIVNYETTWYRSHAAMCNIFKEQNAAGNIRKMVAMDGHPGRRRSMSGRSFSAGSPTR